jgi:hypothetical protein
MKLLLLFALAASLLAGCSPPGKDSAGATPESKPAEEQAGPRVSRNSQGQAVITMSDEAQGDMGILVKKPAPGQMSPEVKGYGRVLDPTPLAGLLNELDSARAAYAASSNELTRLKSLAAQGNASTRALQTAEATALHDQLAIQSAKDRLALGWGRAVADRSDLPAFVQSATSLEAAVLRIDLPMDQKLSSPPGTTLVSTLSGQSVQAELLGPAASVDPQMQGQGFLFIVKPNTVRLAPGEAVTAYLKIPGEPLSGVIVPREAVVRTEGAGWVYRFDAGGEAFTRTEIPLDHPTNAGWFVSKGLSPDDYIVVTGAQQLLSLELKGKGGEE